MDEECRKKNIRTKQKKHNSSFEKLRRLQKTGSKNKFEPLEVDNIFEEVDEEEYIKRVKERQEINSFIIDDEKNEYYDDGREVFEFEDDENICYAERKIESKLKHKGRKNIKNLLLSMPVNKESTKVVHIDDDYLDELIEELHNEIPLGSRPENKKLKIDLADVGKLEEKFTLCTGYKLNQGVSFNSMSLDRKEIKRDKINDSISNNYESVTVHSTNSLSEEIDVNKNQNNNMEYEKCPKSTFFDKKLSQDTVGKKSLYNEAWRSASKNLIFEATPSESKLSFSLDFAEDKMIRFFWLDAFEPPGKSNGTIYLFGKILSKLENIYHSCCVIVKNIPKIIYLLPREKHLKSGNDVMMSDVYEEFRDVIALKYNILEYKSKSVNKNYCFEIPGVPSNSDYLEIHFNAQNLLLPTNLCGDTFSHMFGSNTSCLETFLIRKNVKGPCWFKLNSLEESNPYLSWCKVEIIINNLENIHVYSYENVPPVTLLTVGLKTVINPCLHQNEIVMASCLLHNNFPLNSTSPNPLFETYFCGATTPTGITWPWDISTLNMLNSNYSTKWEKMENERALLNFILTKIYRYDPDIIVGYDLLARDLGILIHRLIVNKIPHWSRIGRLRRTIIPKFHSSNSNRVDTNLFCGRLICDLKISAKQLIRAKTYDLHNLCKQVLKLEDSDHISISVEMVKKSYENSRDFLRIIDMTMQDLLYTLQIICHLNVLSLSLQITHIAGNLLSKTLTGGRSACNEFLLLHAFYEKNFILPDKSTSKRQKSSSKNCNHSMEEQCSCNSHRKPAYLGGLVLEPIKGFYEHYVLLLDFNSLYPSIIQEYNICFTTVEKNDYSELPSLPLNNSVGILPTEIRKLVESRRHIKSLMKDIQLTQDQLAQYDIRQKALKLTANILYGCLGFPNSRFYCKHLASLITWKGREILIQTKDLVQKLNLEVIYGDTDSLMINTKCNDYNEALIIGGKIKQEVNKLYKCLELDIDGIYQNMLLLKKKKYAALRVDKASDGILVYEREVKGLDIVRRDWSNIASNVGSYVLDQILLNQTADDRIINIGAYLEEINKKLKANVIPLNDLKITRQLTKNPTEYSEKDKKNQPHVQIALRLNYGGIENVVSGDAISYIICEDKSALPATQRAYLQNEIENDSQLAVDSNYYLSQQIFPVVSRLCEFIEGISPGKIADYLGLNSQQYDNIHRSKKSPDAVKKLTEEYNLNTKSWDCDAFDVLCPECMEKNSIQSVFVGTDTNIKFSIYNCGNEKCKFIFIDQPYFLLNQLAVTCRKYINKYYKNWLICEDFLCQSHTRKMPTSFTSGSLKCNLCKSNYLQQEYTHAQLYNQLRYFYKMFNTKRAFNNLSDVEKVTITHTENFEIIEKTYHSLLLYMKSILQSNAYSFIDIQSLIKNIIM